MSFLKICVNNGKIKQNSHCKLNKEHYKSFVLANRKPFNFEVVYSMCHHQLEGMSKAPAQGKENYVRCSIELFFFFVCFFIE